MLKVCDSVDEVEETTEVLPSFNGDINLENLPLP